MAPKAKNKAEALKAMKTLRGLTPPDCFYAMGAACACMYEGGRAASLAGRPSSEYCRSDKEQTARNFFNDYMQCMPQQCDPAVAADRESWRAVARALGEAAEQLLKLPAERRDQWSPLQWEALSAADQVDERAAEVAVA